MGEVDTRPVGLTELPDLATLFRGQRNTRHCWCMAFCLPRRSFAAGWLAGGNRRAFERSVAITDVPMGILASVAGRPIGWSACGPRTRYAAATNSPDSVMYDRDRTQDATAWLVPCLYVHPQFRGRGVSAALVAAAVELARDSGAVAVEGWPSTTVDPRSPDAFMGNEALFATLGFSCVRRPVPQRAIMRLELQGNLDGASGSML